MYGLRRLSRVEVNKGVLPNNQIKKKITFIFLKFFQKTLSFSCVVVFMYGTLACNVLFDVSTTRSSVVHT